MKTFPNMGGKGEKEKLDEATAADDRADEELSKEQKSKIS